MITPAISHACTPTDPRKRTFSRVVATALFSVVLTSLAVTTPFLEAGAASGSVSTNGRTLTVSQVDSLQPGQVVTVTGSGYDTRMGVYVATCVIPPPGQAPESCVGGQDRTGSTHYQVWINSDPPDYALNLTRPYGPGGSFSVQIQVDPIVAGGLDCRRVRCAVITRNDHLNLSNRSQDVMVPISFAEPGSGPTGPGLQPPVEPPVEETTTTQAPVDPRSVVPASELSADGLSVSDGSRSLEVSAVSDLDPLGATVEVTGSGFDPDVGIYLALCAQSEYGPAPCSTPPAAAAWFSDHPASDPLGIAIPYGPGGSIAATLVISAQLDATTDCREVECFVTTRRDDEDADDRSRDLAVPVHFARTSPETLEQSATTLELDAAPRAPQTVERSGRPTTIIVALIVVGLVIIATTTVLVRRTRSTSHDSNTDSDTDPGGGSDGGPGSGHTDSEVGS